MERISWPWCCWFGWVLKTFIKVWISSAALGSLNEGSQIWPAWSGILLIIHIHRISQRNRSFNYFFGLRTDFRRIGPVRSWAETTSYRVPQIPRIPTDFFDSYSALRLRARWWRRWRRSRRSWPVRSGISQISADFADNLQNSFFFLGGFEEKAYFCGKVERLKGEDYEYGCFK